MPNPNLTPQQIAELERLMKAGDGFTVNYQGKTYQPNSTSYSSEGGTPTYDGWTAYDEGKQSPEDKYSLWNNSGTYEGDQSFQDMSGIDPLLLAFLASAGGMAAFLPGGFMTGAGAGAGAGVGGAGEAAAGFTPGAAGGGTFGVIDGSAMAAPGFVPSATGGTFGVIDSTIPWGASSASLMGPAVNAAATSAASKSAASGAASGLLGTALKYGLPLAGALAGAKGQDTETTSTRKQDPRFDPYIFGGDGRTGLLDSVYAQLQRSTAPGYQPANMGLLSRPAGTAPGGFSRFFPQR